MKGLGRARFFKGCIHNKLVLLYNTYRKKQKKGNEMKRISLFATYVLMNVFLVLILVSAFTYIIYTNAYREVTEDTQTMQEYSLNQAVQSIDKTLSGFTEMSGYASTDPGLTPYQLQMGNYSTVYALRRLGIYTTPLGLFRVYIYIDGHEMLYSPTGNLSLHYFNELFTCEGQWDSQQMLSFLKEVSHTQLSPPECTIGRKSIREEQFILLASPWINGGVRYGTFIGLMDRTYFQSVLDGAAIDSEGITALLDPSGQLMFYSDSSASQSSGHDAMALAVEEYLAGGEFTWNGAKYTAVSCTSSYNGWKYLAFIPKRRALHLLSNQHIYQFFVILLLLTCGLTVGVLLAFYHYRPIRRIWESLPGQERTTGSPQTGQIMQIQKRISDILRDNETMTHELDENKEAIRQNALLQLLDGSYGQVKERLDELRQKGVQLTGPYYQVMVFRAGEAVSPVLQDAAYQELCLQWENAVETLPYKYIAVLRNTGYEKVPDENKGDSYIALEVLKKLGISGGRVGVGQPYADPSLIHVSYIEALSALESDAPEAIVFFGSFYESHYNSVQWYPNKAQLRLVETVLQGNTNALEPVVREVEAHLRQVQSSSDHRQFRFSLYSVIHDMLLITDRLSLPNVHWEINRMLHYGDMDDFIQQLSAFCTQAALQVRSSKEEQQDKLLGDILQYIDAHYADQDISLAAIAERFELTPSTLSRLFSQYNRIRFIDYLSDKRMEKAAELLSGTELSVKEIVARVGYIDVSSFTRKFTQTYKTSPGKYRKEKRETGMCVL